MNSRIEQFRKSQLKEQAMNNRKQAEDIQNLVKMVLGLAGRVMNLESRLKSIYPTAKIADWRSLAIMKMLSEIGTLSEESVVKRAEAIQIEDFEEESKEDDLRKGLVVADDETAANGHVAIVNIRVFKDGKELEDEQILRSKIEIGKQDMFPELDAALVGMKVGETKRFALELFNQTDESEIKLIGLRKPKEEQKTEENKGSEQSDQSQQH